MPHMLTKRQLEVLQALADGKTPKQIYGNNVRATRILRVARERLNARTNFHLIAIAVRRGIVR